MQYHGDLPMLNEFRFFGTLTKDAKLSKTTGGTPTLVLMIEVTTEKQVSGKPVITRSLIPITVYGTQAIELSGLKTGSVIGAKGEVQSWYSTKSGKGGFNFVANRQSGTEGIVVVERISD